MSNKSKIENFCLPNQKNKDICLEDLKGKWVILYFYPRDNSKGCTIEAQNFSNKLNNIKDLGAEVVGVSPDSVKSHQNFAKKHNLQFNLLSDPEHRVLKQFGVWQKKKMYGKEYMGVIRSTFIINPKGIIVSEWRKVKVNGHVEEVLSTLNKLIN